MLNYFRQFAAYNRWANEQIYEAADGIAEEGRNADRGAFFGSLHGTLNHTLVADRVWMDRLEGKPTEFMKTFRLDTVTHPVWADLRAARNDMDFRIIGYLEGLTEAALHAQVQYEDSSGSKHADSPLEVLPHFFNHQTHHRGQAHDLIHQITGNAPSLDLIAFLRSR
jgi:uncharacterized damage-inducible protein DinB